MVTQSQHRRPTNKNDSRDASRTVRVQDDRRLTQMHVWAVLRISLGWIFLWAFLDKTFGLGVATESDNAWVDGGSPTEGYLSFATRGPLKGWFDWMARDAWADWLFMVGLAAIGVALILGVGMRVAAPSRTLSPAMWSSSALARRCRSTASSSTDAPPSTNRW